MNRTECIEILIQVYKLARKKAKQPPLPHLRSKHVYQCFYTDFDELLGIQNSEKKAYQCVFLSSSVSLVHFFSWHFNANFLEKSLVFRGLQ